MADKIIRLNWPALDLCLPEGASSTGRCNTI
jgi:hypothetical protein